MKATFITGFLGSGKTTFLKRQLRHHAGVRFGVLVHDLSELEVDGELIRLGEAVGERDGTLVSLFGETTEAAFVTALEQLGRSGIDHLLIESSGGRDPAALLHALLVCPEVTLGAVVTLVDARALAHDFAAGRALLTPQPQSTETLWCEQIRLATHLVVTKGDLLAPRLLSEVLEHLAILNPEATLLVAPYGRVDFQPLLEAPPYQRRPGSGAGEYDLGSRVITDPRPFHPERLWRLFREELGLGIYRSKGFIWLASRPDHVLLWNQAGGAFSLELLGLWRAALVNDPNLLAEERAALQQRLAGAHPLFGDRRNELTVIGTARDRAIFVQGLEAALLTPQEVALWLKGHRFRDPWPTRLKELD